MMVFDEDFDEEDTAVALEWQVEQAMLCKGCGRPTDETMAVGADDSYEAEMLVCHACAAADRREKNYREENGDMAGAKRRIWESD